ncbi:MAG: ribonuclease HII [Rhodobacteraceae bacterium]|nr:ribonuclease HII [Paracoccaceae bacterium]MCY4197656.1 ribonuclease HII [Paracoccaceae bacterium]MCY4326209.1 ribonuclease HII [Paracoccaceae bacterium]
MGDLPDAQIEDSLRAKGVVDIAGVDEAGRGPLAGPVVAAAVILPVGRYPAGINDSKRLSAARRYALAIEIKRCALVAVAGVAVAEIDHLNILQATMLAMSKAVDGLTRKPGHVLIDGNRLPAGLQSPATAIIKGDTRSVSIAAASIVAKVERDAIMAELAKEYPQFGWERNAGYGTAAHLAALREYGPTPYHRMGFAPVRRAAITRAEPA